MTRRALLSVTDKTGIVEFGRGLVELGFSIVSTGGTFRALQDGGVPAVDVASYTHFPEMMDGRLKTLHPKVHGGLLACRDRLEHLEAMEVHGIDPIDLLAVNLYRFRETANDPAASAADVIEHIDIGGPAMIRSAAKNHRDVTVVVDPTDYELVLAALRGGAGRLDPVIARRLAGKAFAHTADYDTAIARWFDAQPAAEHGGGRRFGEWFGVCGVKSADLRYGENPHQQAALYVDLDARGSTLARAEQLAGKELSYNNLLDLDAALGLVLEFDRPACVIVKHNNPCGAAIGPTTEAAFRAALASDPLSAYGGIVATNRALDTATATAMVGFGTFVEAIVAPTVDPTALATLAGASWGRNVRVLALGGLPEIAAGSLGLRPVSGGFLVQTNDAPLSQPVEQRPATDRAPTAAERGALDFAWRVAKHVRSNAIVLATGTTDGVFATVGVGAGQMSRVDSVRLAVEKAGARARGAVLASDAFFPFADGLQVALDAGVTAAIQPGGSKRDPEVVAAANAAGAAMVLTGMRHFRH